MVAAIGSPAFTNVPGAAGSTTGLEAQHARLLRQLADWECCSSSKTPEGKAKIKEISEKVKGVETRLAEIDAARQPRQSITSNADNVFSNSGTNASTLSDRIGLESAQDLHSVNVRVGWVLDVHA